MSFTVFLGNLPVWVTADDIKQWLSAEDLVADSVKVIRNHETQESKGFAFVEAPTQDEMQAIIRRFDRAPLEDKVLRANPAQPSKGAVRTGAPPAASQGSSSPAPNGVSHGPSPRSGARNVDRPDRRGGAATNGAAKKREQEPKSAFATELAKVL
jgi:RNA recognition motif-containing protein